MIFIEIINKFVSHQNTLSMKKLLLTFIIALISTVSVNAQNDTLTNQSILDMLSMGFSDNVILAKISNSNTTNFDTSIDALKLLKDKNVSENILVAIIGKNNIETSASGNNASKENKEGIFYLDTINNTETKILPSVFSSTKTNTLGATFSYGIASASIKSVIPNATSNNIIDSCVPLFKFYFNGDENQSFAESVSNWWFKTATSPTEFVLLKLDRKKNKRELKTGSVNIYAGSSIGIDPNAAIPFIVEKINDNQFIIRPKRILPSGEYCFVY